MQTVPFVKAVKTIAPKVKINAKNFKATGRYPIVSQDSSDISGYWDDDADIIHLDQPVVIFGDHTRNIKFIDFDFVAGADGLKILSPVEGLDAKYLYYWMLANPVKSLGYSRHFRILKDKLVSFPDLATQQSLVKKLDSAFEKIDVAIDLQKKRGHLLKRYLVSTIELSFGNMAGSEEVLIEDVASVKGGKRLPKGSSLKTYQTPYPYIRVTDFDKKGGVKESGIQYLDEETHLQISNYTISDSDVFLSIAGSIGITGMVPERLNGANLTENACKITPDACLDKEYLYYFTLTKSFIEQAAGATRQTAQPKLALIRIKNIRLNLPSKQTQKGVVERLNNLSLKVNEAIKLCQDNIKNLEKLKESMLEQSFSMDTVE